MQTIREAIRDVISQRVLPWVERDGIRKLILPEQITPADCATPMKCPRPCTNRRREHEIGIGLTGKSPYCIDNKTFIFTAGRIVLVPAGITTVPPQTKRWFTTEINLNRPSSTLWFRVFPSGVLAQILRVVDKGGGLESTQRYLLLDRHFSRLAACLLEEVRSTQPYNSNIGRCLMLEFLERCRRTVESATPVKILSHSPRSIRKPAKAKPARQKRTNKSAGASAKPHENLVHIAEEFILANYQIPIGLDDIAAAADCSANHLGRLFKETTGETPIEYLTNVRISVAKELLLTEMNITEVGMMLGFHDLSYFGRVFRHSTGLSPLKYRLQMAKKDKMHPASTKFRKP